MSSKLIIEKKTVKELVEVTKTVEEKTGVLLELTLEEAFTLAEVYSQIGGCENDTARKHMRQIAFKLSDLGIDWTYGRYGMFQANSNCYFDKKSKELISELVEKFKKRIDS